MLIGIVGKANVGKSTFFKAATLSEVEIANYPFATIDPNSGVGFVRHACIEKFFKVKCNPNQGFCINGERFIPVKLLDVAGLVPGAHEGKGMGNKFLDDLSAADVLIHVIDAAGSTNEKGEPVKPGSYDPANDVRFLEVELDMWFFGMMKKVWSKFSKVTAMEHKDSVKAIHKQFSGLKINEMMIQKAMKKFGLNNDISKWTDIDLKAFASELRQVSKPMVIAANKADLSVAQENIKKLKKKFPSYKIIPCSAESELALREASKHELIEYVPGNKDFKILKPAKLSDNQKKALDFIKSKVLKKLGKTGVQDCLNMAVFDELKYIVVFPGGMKKLGDSKGRILPDAWLFPQKSNTLDFARYIHEDFVKNFVTAYDVKTKKPIGKEHILKDGDVIELVCGK
jgi:ribosome-binding ATPase